MTAMKGSAVKSRPILFSGEMVRALLEGRKTMTRRIVKSKQPKTWCGLNHVEYARDGMPIWWSSPPDDKIRQSDYYDHGMPCPYGAVGDVLWVREAWRACDDDRLGTCVEYRADNARRKPKFPSDEAGWKCEQDACAIDAHHWRPSIFMPRWASRLTLELTEVRVERLRDIGKDGRKAHDVLAEGVTREQIAHYSKWFHPDDCPALTFAALWDSINGGGSWLSNPWVWVLSFHRVEAP